MGRRPDYGWKQAILFLEALENSGVQQQDIDREYFQIPHNITYTEPDRKV